MCRARWTGVGIFTKGSASPAVASPAAHKVLRVLARRCARARLPAIRKGCSTVDASAFFLPATAGQLDCTTSAAEMADPGGAKPSALTGALRSGTRAPTAASSTGAALLARLLQWLRASARKVARTCPAPHDDTERRATIGRPMSAGGLGVYLDPAAFPCLGPASGGAAGLLSEFDTSEYQAAAAAVLGSSLKVGSIIDIGAGPVVRAL